MTGLAIAKFVPKTTLGLDKRNNIFGLPPYPSYLLFSLFPLPSLVGVPALSPFLCPTSFSMLDLASSWYFLHRSIFFLPVLTFASTCFPPGYQSTSPHPPVLPTLQHHPGIVVPTSLSLHPHFHGHVPMQPSPSQCHCPRPPSSPCTSIFVYQIHHLGPILHYPWGPSTTKNKGFTNEQFYQRNS